MQAIHVVLLAVAQLGNSGLLQVALNPNPALKSYIATAELTGRAHPVPLNRTFRGTVYYLAPARKIVFDNVSGVLRHVQTLTMNTPSWSQAQRDFVITPTSDNGRTAVFTLVPTKRGARVTSLVLSVDDDSALVSRAVYHYGDGSLLRFDPHYQKIGGFYVAASTDISAHFPAYSVDGTIRFTQYRLNAAVPEAIFSGS